MFSPGDRVHLAGIGTGTLRGARGAGRYAVEIKGRVVIAAARDLELAAAKRTRRPRSKPSDVAGPAGSPGGTGPASIALDLHGHTVDEAVVALESFIDAAIVSGHAEVRVIHGRSGGRVKSAVHGYLRRLSSVASFRLAPRNPGVTIVTFV